MSDIRQKGIDEMFCSSCGSIIKKEAEICPNCGVRQKNSPSQSVSPQKRLPALLLCVFLGWLGVHRFYAGKVGTGILWMLTLGLCGVGVFIDLIMICVGSFTDKKGLFIQDWS